MNIPCIFLFLALSVIPRVAPASQPATRNHGPIVINYYNEPGCPECEDIDKTILPSLSNRYAGRYILHNLDLGVKSNYMNLVRYQEQFGTIKNEPVYMVVAEQHLLSGIREIKANLLTRVAEAIRDEETIRASQPAMLATNIPRQANDTGLLQDRFHRFTLPAVMAAGFIDGINPCVISTLVFFMSILAIAGLRGYRLWLLGFWFCLASYAANTAIGFGLLSVLRHLSGFALFRNCLEGVIISLLLVFTFFSFRDAWRFHITGNPASVALQMPHRIKLLAHGMIRKSMGQFPLILTAIGLGVIVTLLESVCTGQVYIPTLTLVIKSGVSVSRGCLLLFVYNAMFIAPLVIVFILVGKGLQIERLLAWSRRNVVISKVILGFLFLALACLMIIL